LALAATAAVVVASGPTAAQRSASAGSVQAAPGWGTGVWTVPDRAGLQARTSDERRLAAHYDWHNPVRERLEGVVHVFACGPVMPPPPPGEEIVRPDYRAFLETVACRYDAIVVGGAALRRVMLNASESALFSEYALSVENWVRPAAGDRVISVSRAGGTARLADGSTLGSEFNSSREPDGRRLFMLTRIEGTSGFQIARSFPIDSGRVQPYFAEIEFGYLPEELVTNTPLDAARFLADLARAGARCPVTGR
jgi:hypothetical protein